MKVKDFCNIMENIAPKRLKENFDNVGLQVGNRNNEVKKILVALDCTLDVIEEAKREKADLIFSHHPLMFIKPSNITTDTIQGKKIIELIKNNITLYSAHTNLDSVKNGLNDRIVNMLGFKSNRIMEVNEEDNESGLGRIVTLEEEKRLEEIIGLVKIRLEIKNLRFVGNKENKIKKIAIINGSGQDFFGKAEKQGVDCIITGDTTYHRVNDFKEMGISIIDIGHFYSEWPVMISLIKDLEMDIKDGENIEIIFSKLIKDPYEFI